MVFLFVECKQSKTSSRNGTKQLGGEVQKLKIVGYELKVSLRISRTCSGFDFSCSINIWSINLPHWSIESLIKTSTWVGSFFFLGCSGDQSIPSSPLGRCLEAPSHLANYYRQNSEKKET